MLETCTLGTLCGSRTTVSFETYQLQTLNELGVVQRFLFLVFFFFEKSYKAIDSKL